MDQDKKQKAIEVAIEQIKKQTKDPEAVVRLTDKGGKKYKKGSISTGSISLDSAIGIGGVPRGKIIEVYGPESSGKTTLALHIIAQAQKDNGYAAFIDAEHALDPNYAEKLISLIERFELTRFDSKMAKSNAEKYSVSKQMNNFIHIVKKGDTLYSISKQYGVTLDNLVRVNQIKDQVIFINQELKIPIKN